MTSSVHQAREALGHRLRDLRKDAGLTGRGLAELAGWHSSKVSKLEFGKQNLSEADIRVWCQHTGAESQIADLIATARHIEAMYVEWRRMLGTGTRRRQNASRTLEAMPLSLSRSCCSEGDRADVDRAGPGWRTPVSPGFLTW